MWACSSTTGPTPLVHACPTLFVRRSKASSKRCESLKRSGYMKASSAYSSWRLFWTGVPEAGRQERGQGQGGGQGSAWVGRPGLGIGVGVVWGTQGGWGGWVCSKARARGAPAAAPLGAAGELRMDTAKKCSAVLRQLGATFLRPSTALTGPAHPYRGCSAALLALRQVGTAAPLLAPPDARAHVVARTCAARLLLMEHSPWRPLGSA